MRSLVIGLAAACGAGSSSPNAARGSDSTSPKTARGESVTSACQAENVQQGDARKLFRHCPHWRMVLPEACGSSTQPSFIDPCICMCDLCETDADCGGGKCISVDSMMVGGYPQKTCVRAGEPCFPDGACPGKMVCRNYDGRAICETPQSLD